MLHTYYFIKRLSAALNQKLAGSRLIDCFSQQKDELLLEFLASDGRLFCIRAEFAQNRGLLSFPEQLHRSRQNTVQLFPELIGMPVEKVVQSDHDRSFHLQFPNSQWLCFKLYGLRCNVLLHDGEKVKAVFNHHLRKDLENPPPPLTKAAADSAREADPWVEERKTMTPELWQDWEVFLKDGSFSTENQARTAFLKHLDTGSMYLVKHNDLVETRFFPAHEVIWSGVSALDLANLYQKYYWTVNQFALAKKQEIAALEKALFQTKEREKRLRTSLEKTENQGGYRRQADVLMAFGQQIAKGEHLVQLPDFSGQMIQIQLKPELNVAQNAQRLYAKAKGQEADSRRLHSELEEVQTRKEKLLDRLKLVVEATSWPALKRLQLERTQHSGEEDEDLPYRKILHMGVEIWIGRNAKSNEEILRRSHKNDIWLHAKDVAGSHVLIRKASHAQIPKPVLMRAAALAAFYSKAKNEGTAAVIFTERKYVRKGKKLAEGQVIVEKEKVLLVAPEA